MINNTLPHWSVPSSMHICFSLKKYSVHVQLFQVLSQILHFSGNPQWRPHLVPLICTLSTMYFTFFDDIRSFLKHITTVLMVFFFTPNFVIIIIILCYKFIGEPYQKCVWHALAPFVDVLFSYFHRSCIFYFYVFFLSFIV